MSDSRDGHELGYADRGEVGGAIEEEDPIASVLFGSALTVNGERIRTASRSGIDKMMLSRGTFSTILIPP